MVIDLDVGGEDVDRDSKISQIAASCQGSFNDEQTFFVGVAHHEGMDTDTIIGWGRNLCDNASVDWDTNYSVRLRLSNMVFETGQIFTCGKDHGKEM